MVKAKNSGHGTSAASPVLQAKQDTKKAGSSTVWVREDGAICIDNECVVIQSASDGAVEFTINPNKCSCQAGNAIYESVMKGALSGQGSRIHVLPGDKKKS